MACARPSNAGETHRRPSDNSQNMTSALNAPAKILFNHIEDDTLITNEAELGKELGHRISPE